jgi:hypothetical protein
MPKSPVSSATIRGRRATVQEVGSVALHNRAPDPVPLEELVRAERVGDLEISSDLRFQDREWVVQRVGWAVMVVVLLLTAAGLLGGWGPLNQHVLRGEQGLSLELERVVRHGGEARFAMVVPPELAAEGTVTVWIDRSWLQGLTMEVTPVPEPLSTSVHGDVVLYDFAMSDPARPGRIEMEFVPDDLGRREGRFGLQGGPSLSFSQLVLP